MPKKKISKDKVPAGFRLPHGYEIVKKKPKKRKK